MAKKKQKTLLSREQVDVLLKSMSNARKRPVTLVEAQCVVSWAEETITRAQLLDAVMNGMLLIDWKDDGPTFVEAKPL